MKNETEIQKRARELGKEPAFPTSSLETAFGYTGLTKRQQFAAMVVQGFCSQQETPDLPPLSTMAKNAVAHADALLIALAESEVTNG